MQSPYRYMALPCCIALASAALTGCPFAPLPTEFLSPADGAVIDESQVTLTIATPPGYIGDVNFYGRQVVPHGEDFTIVALPDTQYYSESYPEIFQAQTEWIVAERAARNIVAVLHLGDIVDNADDLGQWGAADAAMSILDAHPDLPVGLAVGNHDESPRANPDGTANFNLYFPASRYEGLPWYGGHYGDDNDNSYVLFSGGGIDFISICLEFDRGGDADVLAWADDLLKQHADRRAIVVTHFALASGVLADKFSKQGQAIRDALGDNPNLFLFLGGHFCGTGARTDDFAAANVTSLLADYQCWPNGGDGWLRLLDFSPASATLRVRTYSPTRHEYLDGPRNQFVVPFEAEPVPEFELIGSVSVVDSDTTASITWANLVGDANYEWIVDLGAASHAPAGSVSRFETR